MKKQTQMSVKTNWLQAAADRIEADAKVALSGWALTGRVHRYREDIGLAKVLREAAELKGVSVRRAFLRTHGLPC